MNKKLITAFTFLGLTGVTAGQQSASPPRSGQPGSSSSEGSTTLLQPGKPSQKLLKSEQERKLIKTQLEEKDRNRQVEEKWRKDELEHKRLKSELEEKDRKSQQEKKLRAAQVESKAFKNQLQEKDRKAQSETNSAVPAAKHPHANVGDSARPKQ